MMTDNAVRIAPKPIVAPTGIHLVYSRSRPAPVVDRSARQDVSQIIRRTPAPRPRSRAEEPSRNTMRLSLAAAMCSAPIVWLGHEILRWKHLL